VRVIKSKWKEASTPERYQEPRRDQEREEASTTSTEDGGVVHAYCRKQNSSEGSLEDGYTQEKLVQKETAQTVKSDRGSHQDSWLYAFPFPFPFAVCPFKEKSDFPCSLSGPTDPTSCRPRYCECVRVSSSFVRMI